MNREQIGVLLAEAHKLIHHREFVIVGSLSVLGTIPDPPEEMVYSIDVDLYPLRDPGRAGELARLIGQGSPFEEEHGYYADAVSPQLPTLPDGWSDRLIRVQYQDGIVGLYLDPDDAAVSKYARLEERDERWIRGGLKAGILDPKTIEKRMSTAPFLDAAEEARAHAALAADCQWLSELPSDTPS